MRVRHRMPMVFSLSMLDVFCCALGCVTLLWLVNQREAMLRAKDATKLLANLDISRSDLKSFQAQLAAALAERDQSLGNAARLRVDLDAARIQAADLSTSLAAANSKIETVNDRLTKQSADLQMLTRNAQVAKARITELETDLRDEEALYASADKKAKDLANQLRDADAAASKLRTAASVKGDQLTDAESKLKAIEGELEASRRMMAGLEGEKKTMVNELAKARFAVENRFEGIALSGRRVIFLVDMSGSMDMLDPNNNAPNKWAGVRETLIKLYRSLPELEKFQIILFSDQLVYLLGGEGKWLDPDPQSVQRIDAAMKSTPPKGNTDMYQAMDAAFRYRPAGLDTIYLLSDGLPNIGAGLTPDAARTMRETDRAEVLSKHIRMTLRSNWNAPQASRPRVRVNAVGFFYESPDVGAFLWALSRENDGAFVGMSKP